MRRILALLMAFIMAVATPVSVLADVTDEPAYDSASEVAVLSEVASGTCGDNLTWVLDDEGTLTISGTGDMYDWSTSSYAPWFVDRTSIISVNIESGCTYIGARSFYECTYISSINIPESVSDIGYWAFYDCSSLTSVIIPSSVTSLQASVFSNCIRLTSITLPEGLTTIETNAFSGCSSLTTITLPEGLTTIKQSAFDSCSSLTAVTLPQSLTSLGGYTFNNCSSLKSIIIPDLITVIDVCTFKSCKCLSDVVLPDGLESIESMAFYDCSSLVNINFPDSLTAIAGMAFADCSSLTSISIPEGILHIDSNTFENCTNLSEIFLCKGIISIADGAFRGCPNLQTVYYSGNAEDWEIINIGENNSYLLNATLCCSDTVDISSFTPSLSFTECVYNGEEQQPDVTIEKNSVILKENVDYILDYSNNINVGTAIVTITGINNYEGELVDSFVINKADQNLTASCDDEYIEIGQTSCITTNGQGALSFISSNESVVKVDNDGVLTSVGIGTATISIEALGNENYNSAKTSIDITVVKASQKITANIESSTIKCGQTTSITADGIGEISYESNDETIVNVNDNGVVTGISEGTAIITITASGDDNYNPAFTTITVSVSCVDISNCLISLSSSSYIYDGVAKKPTITVKNGNSTLSEETDYTVMYSNNTNAGTASVTVTGIGNYTGAATKEFTIEKADQTLSVTTSASSIEVGKTATITASGQGTISYSSSNTSVATVSSSGVVTGKSVGTVIITVNAAGDSNYNSESAEVEITITETSSGTSGSGSNSENTGNSNSGKSSTAAGTSSSSSSGSGSGNTNNSSSTTSNSTSTTSGSTSSASSNSDTSVKLKKGSTYTSGNFKYKITSLPSSGTGKVTVTAPAKSTITKATIPTTVKIGDRSFKVTQVASGAFKNCKKLKSATVGKNVTTIGSQAFYGCKALKKVNLTSTSLTTISSSAFQNCTAMTSFTANSTKLKSIGKKAFYGDKKLATVTLKTSKLTKSNVKASAFKGIKSTCTFKVPSKKVSAYKKIFKARGAGSKITVKKG